MPPQILYHLVGSKTQPMEKVDLTGTDLRASRLGFGCASLMGRLGRRSSVRILELAHESGITHFDTARSYGYGEAEGALGEFLAGRRDELTVTTKLGIQPPRRSSGRQAVKAGARAVARAVPCARRGLRRRAQAMVKAGRFTPEEARASLETSLRELRTDHVDILLLHECTPEDLGQDGLLDFLHDVVREGKVQRFGTATSAASTSAILRDAPEFASVIQLPDDPIERPLATLAVPQGTAIITHSVLGAALSTLVGHLTDADRRTRWSHEFDVDCSRPEVVGSLLLAYALHSNADGMVLFSSTDEGRIRSNAALLEGRPFDPDRLERFGELARTAVLEAPGRT
jgi:aryl-alcohol dehydrogenase-like predicted oxidoreductase